jgi:hypothetical protein
MGRGIGTMTTEVYNTSSIKSGRRTKAEIDTIRGAMYGIVSTNQPMTVRQVFYQLVSDGKIAKTEAEYRQTVCRMLTEMRLSGVMPFGWIADNTRWMRKPRTFDSLEESLRLNMETYRRSLWTRMPVYVEIWLEKDALAGVLYDITSEWDVPLMVTRGYPSISYMYESATYMESMKKSAYIYYFGDYDPSGLDISRTVEQRLREFAPSVDLNFNRVAVTEEQIRMWNLPTRPTKQTDTRANKFGADISVEVDAIKPDLLRNLAEVCITRHIDQDEYNRLLKVEEAERETLHSLVVNLR